MSRDPAEESEDLAGALFNALKNNNRVVHLRDIFQDNRRPLSYYYGSDAGGFSNGKRTAEELARKFQDPAEEFLHRLSNDFTRSQRNRRKLDDVLLDQGLNADFIEEANPTYTEYLLLLYHFFYAPEENTVPEYQYLNAKTLLFQDQTGSTFYHHQPLYIEDSHLHRKCQQAARDISKNSRNFHIEPLLIEDESEAVLKFYWERTRNPEMIFRSRLPTDHPNSGDSGVTHRAAYPIKTLTIRLENEDDQCKINLSKSKHGWERNLRTFFNIAFNLPNPFSAFEPKRDAAVERVITAAREAAKEADEGEAEETRIYEAAMSEMDELREAAVEQTREEEGDEAAEALDNRYASIEPSGLIIRDDDETLSEEFSIKSKATLEAWEAKNEGGTTIISHELNTAEKDKIGIRFRGHLRSEDKTDEFIFVNGTWEPEDGSGVPQETSEMLNQLLGETDG